MARTARHPRTSMDRAINKKIKLTKKQKVFADELLDTGLKAKSALKAYDTTKIEVAAVIANENLKKPNVIAYLESKADRAAERIVELSEQDEALPVALGASKDILDRAGFKPIEKSVTVNLDAELTESARELGRKLLQRQRT